MKMSMRMRIRMRMQIRMTMKMRIRMKMRMVMFFFFCNDRYDKSIVAIARASRSSLLFSARKHETTAARS